MYRENFIIAVLLALIVVCGLALTNFIERSTPTDTSQIVETAPALSASTDSGQVIEATPASPAPIVLDCQDVQFQIAGEPDTRAMIKRCVMPGGETCLLSSNSRSYSLVYCYPEQPK